MRSRTGCIDVSPCSRKRSSASRRAASNFSTRRASFICSTIETIVGCRTSAMAWATFLLCTLPISRQWLVQVRGSMTRVSRHLAMPPALQSPRAYLTDHQPEIRRKSRLSGVLNSSPHSRLDHGPRRTRCTSNSEHSTASCRQRIRKRNTSSTTGTNDLQSQRARRASQPYT